MILGQLRIWARHTTYAALTQGNPYMGAVPLRAQVTEEPSSWFMSTANHHAMLTGTWSKGLGRSGSGSIGKYYVILILGTPATELIVTILKLSLHKGTSDIALFGPSIFLPNWPPQEIDIIIRTITIILKSGYHMTSLREGKVSKTTLWMGGGGYPQNPQLIFWQNKFP